MKYFVGILSERSAGQAWPKAWMPEAGRLSMDANDGQEDPSRASEDRQKYFTSMRRLFTIADAMLMTYSELKYPKKLVDIKPITNIYCI